MLRFCQPARHDHSIVSDPGWKFTKCVTYTSFSKSVTYGKNIHNMPQLWQKMLTLYGLTVDSTNVEGRLSRKRSRYAMAWAAISFLSLKASTSCHAQSPNRQLCRIIRLRRSMQTRLSISRSSRLSHNLINNCKSEVSISYLVRWLILKTAQAASSSSLSKTYSQAIRNQTAD